jgi:hypothetical protein
MVKEGAMKEKKATIIGYASHKGATNSSSGFTQPSGRFCADLFYSQAGIDRATLVEFYELQY